MPGGSIGAAAAREATHEVLGLAGFPDPRAGYARYPFELSGGLRQRAVIAMALICDPALVIADEPTTALDVTVQAQILALLRSLQQRLHTTVLLITHDLGVVANMADDVVVMHRGEVMEAAPVRSIFANPRVTARVPSVRFMELVKGLSRQASRITSLRRLTGSRILRMRSSETASSSTSMSRLSIASAGMR